MPLISEEIQLNCSKETAFREIATIDYMKSIDPNYSNTRMLFKNDRLLRSISKVATIGDVEIERIMIPETFTIITQRRPPLAPFTYQLSIQILNGHGSATIMKWINEFELDDTNKPREEMILSYIKGNDVRNLQKTKEYIEGKHL